MSSIANHSFLFAQGLLSGTGHVRSFCSIESVTHGKTDFAAYQQSNAIYKNVHAIFYILKQNKVWNVSRFSGKLIAALISIPIPFALQIINHRIDSTRNPRLKEAVVYLRDHVPQINFAVNLCVQVIFAFYMSPLFLVGTTIGFTMEMLHEHNMLSAKTQAIWEKLSVLIVIGLILDLTFVMEIDPFELAFAASSFFIFVWEHYFEKYPPDRLLEHRLDIEQAKSILEQPKQMRIDWKHLYQDPKLAAAVSEVDIVETMKELIAKVRWTGNDLSVYKLKLLSDIRFCELFPVMREERDISDEFSIKRFQDGALLIANEIANGQIAKGNSFVRYDITQGMLKAILKNLNESEDFLDDLLKLSLEGGDYCATEKVEVIEEILERRILDGKKVPLKLKFLFQLNAMRRRWFESLYAKAAQYSYNLPKGIIDFSDIHFRNIALFYFDKCFKLHSEALKNDSSLEEIKGFCNYLYRFVFARIGEQTFWRYAANSAEWYSPEAMIEEMRSSSLTGVTVAEWWREWIEQQPKEFQEELDKKLLLEGKILEQPVSVSDGKQQKLNPEIIRLMMFDMNLLEFA